MLDVAELGCVWDVRASGADVALIEAMHAAVNVVAMALRIAKDGVPAFADRDAV